MYSEISDAASWYSTWVALTLGLALCLILSMCSRWRWGNKTEGATLPPGPWGIPLLGSLAFLGGDFYSKECVDWTKKYGPVFRIKLGVKSIVLVNDFELIKEALCRTECLSRPRSWIFKNVGGIASLNSKPWQENRRFCNKMLRELTHGKKSMLGHIEEEFQYLRDKVAEAKGQPIVLRRTLLHSVSNNIATLLLGSRYQLNDPKQKQLEKLLMTFEILFTKVPQVEPLPKFLGFISRFIFDLAGGICGGQFVKQLFEFFGHEVDRRLETTEANVKRHFIDGYLAMIKKHATTPDLKFSTHALRGHVIDLLLAGSSSVAITMLCILLHCADNPSTIQARIQREIDDVVGCDRSPTWEDHLLMPYTMAVIWEMTRWKTLNRLNLPREAEEDFILNGFLIPKGTIVIANLWAAHMDPKYWKNPEKFDPSRFLTQDGTTLLPKPECLIPFSTGKRMCPGEFVATAQIFLCITTLLQEFRVESGDGSSFCVASNNFPVLLSKGLCFQSRISE